jgi:hypothetical protein
MKSLFNKTDNDGFIARINSLKASAPAQWGKMTVSQMLAHCQQPLKVAFGESSQKRGLMSFLFGNMVRKRLVADEKPFKRELPTDRSFVIHDQPDFETERQKLVAMVRRFADGKKVIVGEKHPFFGKLTPEEWDIIQSKHLDHHLKQFGA